VSQWQHAIEKLLELQRVESVNGEVCIDRVPLPETSEDAIFPILKWVTQMPNL